MTKNFVAMIVLLFALTFTIDADSVAHNPPEPRKRDSPGTQQDERASGKKLPDLVESQQKQQTVDLHLLNDLSRIRRQMGGSVLKGSSLEALGEDQPTAAESFETNLKTLLSTSPDAEPRNPISPQPAEAAGPFLSQDYLVGDEHSSPKYAASEKLVVTVLRRESGQLEQVANQLEITRQYPQADALRATAKKLRELARQLDTPAAGVLSPKARKGRTLPRGRLEASQPAQSALPNGWAD